VITDKSNPFSFRSDVTSALAEEIVSSDEKAVVVHGGGSYGHTVAKQYGLSSTTGSPGPGVSETRMAMLELDQLVCKTMRDYRMKPYPFSPFDLFTKAGSSAAANWLRNLLKADLTPITFGDVVQVGSSFKVLSGDDIAYELARVLRPERVVFALNVDGVYEPNTKVIIPELTPSKVRKVKVETGDDATGGMGRKLQVASKIASMGVRVSFVSGYRRNEFAKALKGLDFYGTMVKS